MNSTSNRSTVIGPPGTGKTENLITVATAAVLMYQPNRVGYFSFTRQAANEARTRMRNNKGLAFFRTLHSLAFLQLGLSRGRIMNGQAMANFAEENHFELTRRTTDLYSDYDWPTITDHDRAMFLYNFARVRCLTEEKMWELPFEQRQSKAEEIIEKYQLYKSKHGYIDFTDMLYRLRETQRYPFLDSIIIDEGQDLSTLQWKIVQDLMDFNPHAMVDIAMDGDQSIYQWAGADFKAMEKMVQQIGNVEFLNESHRIPRGIHLLAYRIINTCQERLIKNTWWPRPEDGELTYGHHLETYKFNPKHSYLYLTRNNHRLFKAAKLLEQRGITYVQLSTIHGSKGAQADCVLLDLDMDKASYNELNTDSETRVWYVATTRAKIALRILEPTEITNAESLVYKP